MENNLIPISEMAKMHHLTRQTLIYYDHINILKPVYINESGYRYYSIYQIPILREICLLKKLGIRLEHIKENIGNRSPDTVIQLLENQKKEIDAQICELNRVRMYVQQRINFYEDSHEPHQLNTPVLRQIAPRKLLFVPYPSGLSKDVLHLTFIKAWNILFEYGMVPSNGFGTLIQRSRFETDDIYKDSGLFIVLPQLQQIPDVMEIPGGTFVCMYKYSYPYYEEDLRFLLRWVREHDYTITGDALDVCLLDTTFYNSEQDVDFCCLQIPVVKK